jgi:hypothetical protein
MNTNNKLVKTVMDSAVVVGLAAGIGYVAKKMLKENFLGDPSSSLANYGKLTLVISGSMAAKDYLEKEKILPKSV